MSQQQPLPHPPNPKARSRRISACPRHPSQPIIGFCALCLQERLSLLQSPSPSSVIPPPSHLRRTKSVSASSASASTAAAAPEPRRFSCDARGGKHQTLSYLFDVDDENVIVNRVVESKNLGFSIPNHRTEITEIRVCTDVFVQNEEDDLKTMKEHIDLEFSESKRKTKDISASFRIAASMFSKKLQKWRPKSKIRKGSSGRGDDNNGGVRSEVGECGLGRRSCDTEPRFSVDLNRISVDEPRASWDGYLVARTIPRLAPMLSGVENMMMSRMEEQMCSIKEDEITSGLSGRSHSDSSSGERRSSFDRSSSIRSCSTKGLGVEGDEGKLTKVSPENSDVFNGSKLVITEKELKDWQFGYVQDDRLKSVEMVAKDASVDTLNGFKKFTKWRMVGNIWGSRNKHVEKKDGSLVGSVNANPVTGHCVERRWSVDGLDTAISSGKLTRSSSRFTSANVIGSDERMRSGFTAGDSAKKGVQDFMLERNKSTRYSPSNFDNGLSRFYLTPFRRSYTRSKSGRGRAKNSSNAIAGKVIHLS